MHEDKAQLRKRLRAARRMRAADGAYALQAALSLRENVLSLLSQKEISLPAGSVIAAYYPLGDEISPLPLFDALRSDDYAVALPVTSGRDAALTFRRFDAGDALQKSAFGVAEPLAGPAVRPDLILVPLLAFDARGHRLGYGAGHYDRTLAELAVPAVGLAFDFQREEALPAEAHDRALDCVVTDKALYWPQR